MTLEKTILLDGAMGTELTSRGVDLPLPVWSSDANLQHKEIVFNIHRDYAEAGADIARTNTFRTTTYTYRKAGFSALNAKTRARDSLLSAVEIAQEAGRDRVRVAGSMTSVDDCYHPELYPGIGAAEDTYGEMLEWFTEGGVGFYIFETMGNIEEIEIGLSLSEAICDETWVSLILKDGDQLLDGTSLEACNKLIGKSHASCLLLNCNRIETMNDGITGLTEFWKRNWGVYPNLGITDFDNDYFDTINESKFDEYFHKLLRLNPTAIGACCGSTPGHIKRLKEMIEKQ